MKLTYVANIRIPTEQAHGIHIMEMCQAFSLLGIDVELVVRNSEAEIKIDPFEFYDIKPIFRIKKIWCLDTVTFGRLGFLLELLTFSLSLFFYSLGNKSIFYTRDEVPALVLKVMGKNPILESHMGHKNLAMRLLVILKNRIVVITYALKELYVSLGASLDKILVVADGADVERFDINISMDEARQKLGLSGDKNIVLYKGTLIPWKGVDTLLKSAEYIKTPNTEIVIIGGEPEEVEKLRKEYVSKENVKLVGRVPRRETPLYQKAANILVIPNSAKEDISKLYTSPLKLFGYMASSVPIVASSVPSIREVLDESNSFLFTPDDPESLAETIDKALNNSEEAKEKSRLALEKVQGFSWKKRAETIINFIKK